MKQAKPREPPDIDLFELIEKLNERTTQSTEDRPILVTGAAGAIGGIGRNVTEMLLAKRHQVRALVHACRTCQITQAQFASADLFKGVPGRRNQGVA